MKATLFCVAMTLAAPAYGQTNQHGEVFTGESVSTQLAKLATDAKTTGSGGTTLGDYGSHAIKLSVRAKSGNAEIHAHFDDVFVVTGGSATLITGGTVLNAKIHSEGETQGSAGFEHQFAEAGVQDITALAACGAYAQLQVRVLR